MPTINAVSTLAFSLSSLEVALQHIAAYGFTQVELSDQLTHSQHFGVDTVDPLEVKRLLARHGLAPVAVNAFTIGVPDTGEWADNRKPDKVQKGTSSEVAQITEAKQKLVFYKLHDERQADAYRRRAQRLIDKAKLAGIPKVCLQGGHRLNIENHASELEAAARVLDQLGNYAERQGIRILLEMPHVWNIYFDHESSVRMLSHLQCDNIGVLLDSTHWHTTGYDLDSYLRFLGDRLWHVHLRDAAGRDDGEADYKLEITPGQGDVDFGHLADRLDTHGYAGDVTLETEYKNYSDPEEVDEENRQALAHLKSVGWQLATIA